MTIFDQSEMDDGCLMERRNDVPSHIIPLAQPGMIARNEMDVYSQSPFYVKPRLDADLIKWGLQFYKHANAKHVEKAMPALRDLSLLSKELYQDFAKENNSFFYEEKGLLMLYKTEKVGHEMFLEGREAEKLGLKVDYLSAADVSKLEKGTKTDVLGAVHYKSDAHLYPQKFLQFIKKELEHLKVAIHSATTVQDFVLTTIKLQKL